MGLQFKKIIKMKTVTEVLTLSHKEVKKHFDYKQSSQSEIFQEFLVYS